MAPFPPLGFCFYVFNSIFVFIFVFRVEAAEVVFPNGKLHTFPVSIEVT